MRPSARVVWAVCASLVLHGALVLAVGQLAPERTLHTPRVLEAAAVAVEVALAPASSAPAANTPPLGQPELLPGGPESPGALDQDAAPGRGGEGASAELGALLSSAPSPLTLQDTDLNNLAENQAQRIRTSRERATLEQRRASPKAASAVFLASGTRGHAERRPLRKRDAAHGALTGDVPSLEGNAGALPQPGDTQQAQRQAALGGPEQQVALGILHGEGAAPSRAALVDYARPNVDPGPAATTAQLEDARVRDNVDAELLAARLQRSLVDSSVQESTQRGSGLGGAQQRGPALDQQGSGAGARALPHLPGPGRFGALNTADSRYLRWFMSQKSRVQDKLVFPFERALAMDQGTSVYRVEVRRDGSLRAAPTLVRSSGFSDFDAAAVRAIQRAAPFEPLPAALAPELDRLSLIIPVAFANPMVQ